MNKKYWLTGGIVFVLLYAVLLVITMPKNLAVDMDDFIFGLAMLQYPITVIEDLFDIIPNNVPALMIIGGVATWFILGSLVGFIYGKFKMAKLFR